MSTSNYPSSGFKIGNSLKLLNKNPEALQALTYFVANSLDIDFRINGFTETIDQFGGGSSLSVGDRYIIGTNEGGSPIIPTHVQNNYIDDWNDLEINDVIVWNQTSSGFAWELLYDASNAGFAATGGAFAYVVSENNFYGWHGTVEGWKTIGGGDTGADGDTGERGYYGSKYNLVGSVGDVNAAGEFFIANSGNLIDRIIRIHKQGEIAGDLFDVFYPNGTDALVARNPYVNLNIFNRTKQRLLSIRTRLSNANIQDTDELSIGLNPAVTEILASDSGTGTWSAENAWSSGDEIYVIATRDGVDGEEGAVGATGQGITYAGLSAGELALRYVNADGSLGNTFGTGIFGITGNDGDAGEVGFLMTAGSDIVGGDGIDAGGVWGEASSDILPLSYTFNAVDDAGRILYFKDYFNAGETLDYIVISEVAGEVTDSPVYSTLNITDEEWESSTGTFNRPGELFFYRKEQNKLVLQSFVSYEKVAPLRGRNQLTLVNVHGRGVNNDAPLGITNESEIYVLPVPKGVRGTGLTFDSVRDGVLWLSYIDENGNTFGAFSTGIEGITGNQGGVNPFNIPYIIDVTVDGSTAGEIIPNIVPGNKLASYVVVSGTADNGDAVYDYVSYPTSYSIPRGFFTVFADNDISNFGIFRWEGITTDSVQNVVTYSDVYHVAGNLETIYGTPPTGLPEGSKIYFALNPDGQPGGVTGVGWTYGNEYFCKDILNRPTIRTDGNPLEIGDKWFCTDIGIEFTFLGVNGYAGPDAAYAPVTNNDVVWVQTNNARQGARGPIGPQGDTGPDGLRGPSGINYVTRWTNSDTTLNYGDAVYISYADAIANAGGANIANVTNNWTASYLPSGAQDGVFIYKSDTPRTMSVAGVPGRQSFDWFNPNSYWAPISMGVAGEEGQPGEGYTGASIHEIGVTGEGDERFLQYKLISWPGGGAPSITNWIVLDNEDQNIKGATGSVDLGPVASSRGLYKDSVTGVLTSAEGLAFDGDLAILKRYREYPALCKTQTTGDLNSEILKLDASIAPVQFINSSVVGGNINKTITRVEIENLHDTGDYPSSFTLFIPGNINFQWNVPSTGYIDQAINPGTAYNFVFVSNQSFPDVSDIILATGSTEWSGLTFRLWRDGGNRYLFVNHLNFTQPSG